MTIALKRCLAVFILVGLVFDPATASAIAQPVLPVQHAPHTSLALFTCEAFASRATQPRYTYAVALAASIMVFGATHLNAQPRFSSFQDAVHTIQSLPYFWPAIDVAIFSVIGAGIFVLVKVFTRKKPYGLEQIRESVIAVRLGTAKKHQEDQTQKAAASKEREKTQPLSSEQVLRTLPTDIQNAVRILMETSWVIQATPVIKRFGGEESESEMRSGVTVTLEAAHAVGQDVVFKLIQAIPKDSKMRNVRLYSLELHLSGNDPLLLIPSAAIDRQALNAKVRGALNVAKREVEVYRERRSTPRGGPLTSLLFLAILALSSIGWAPSTQGGISFGAAFWDLGIIIAFLVFSFIGVLIFASVPLLLGAYIWPKIRRVGIRIFLAKPEPALWRLHNALDKQIEGSVRDFLNRFRNSEGVQPPIKSARASSVIDSKHRWKNRNPLIILAAVALSTVHLSAQGSIIAHAAEWFRPTHPSNHLTGAAA